MYVKHFSLSGRPFSGGSDARFLVPNDGVEAVVQRLQDVMTGSGSASVVSGGPGVGKTALVTHAATPLGDEVVVAWADIRQWEPESLLDQLLMSLGTEPGDGSGPVSGSRLGDAVREHNRAGSTVTAAIDVGTVTAERARRLLRLAHMLGDGGLRLNLVLLGPHTVHKMLDVPGMIHLRQRVTMRHRVRPLDQQETGRYIAEALGAVDGDTVEILGDDVPGLVYRYVAGVPRLINTLMDAALMETAIRQLPRVTADVIAQVTKGLGWRPLAGKAPAPRPQPAAAPAPKPAANPLTMPPAAGKPPSPPAAPPEQAPAEQSDATASLVAPLGLDIAADKPAEPEKQAPAPEPAIVSVPEMDPEDTSATGMLRLEDLDERFAEHVFSEEK
jgi:general secretion pathway protein A